MDLVRGDEVRGDLVCEGFRGCGRIDEEEVAAFCSETFGNGGADSWVGCLLAGEISQGMRYEGSDDAFYLPRDPPVMIPNLPSYGRWKFVVPLLAIVGLK